MILQAIKDYNIDIEKSFMIGDRTSDIKIGIASNVTPICIGEKPFEGFETVRTFPTLLEAANWIVNNSKC